MQEELADWRHVSWEEYFALGANQSSYVKGANYPDLSVVGALVSNSNGLGTATLIAPNVILTAAHVIKNSYTDSQPQVSGSFTWEITCKAH